MRRIIFGAAVLILVGFSIFLVVRGFGLRSEKTDLLQAITLLGRQQEQTRENIKIAEFQIMIAGQMIFVAQDEIDALIAQENALITSIQESDKSIYGLNIDIAGLANALKDLQEKRVQLENKKTEFESARTELENRKAELETRQRELEEAVRQAKAKKITPAPKPIFVPTPVEEPKYPVRTIYVVSPELEPYVRGAIALLARSLGYSPFQITGHGGDIEILLRMPVLGDRIIAEAVPRWLNPWVEKQWININPYCFPRVGGWEATIAHELGHMLGWRDLDSHPYMALPLVPGTYYSSNLVVMCN